MSVPPAGQAGGGPGPAWYPDPSIPGYIRFWNGHAWAAGTSRPEPRAGEPLPAPPLGAAPAPAPAAPVPTVSAPAKPVPEQTGPVFFDEAQASPGEVSPAGEPAPPTARAEPGPVDVQAAPGDAAPLPELRGRRGAVARTDSVGWRADAHQQSGLGADRDHRVTWGADEDISTSPVTGAGRGTADPRSGFRRPSPASPRPSPAAQPVAQPQEPDHTIGLRGERELPGGRPWTQQVRELAEQAPATTPSVGDIPPTAAQGQVSGVIPGQTGPRQGLPVPGASAPVAPPGGIPGQPGPGGALSGPEQAAVPAPAGPQPFGVTPSPHPGPLQPGLLRPPPPELFGITEQVAPAGLGRRLLGRLLDSLLPLAGAAAAAYPLARDARDHIEAKVDAVEQAGVTQDIWLIDGTTGGYLALVLGVFLTLGLLFEALPTALWGRSLGKLVCGTRVLDVERQERPSFLASVSRWFVHQSLWLVVIGIVNVLWCVRDRPWRQCWHDKAAGTYVARPSQTPSLP